MKSRIALIAAVAHHGVIGRDNALIWRLRDDMRHFKALTLDHAVIMGRKTWDSLGRRPLPQRRNIVITRQKNFGAPGAEVVRSLEEAISRCIGDNTIFIIGGGQIYTQALPLADHLYLTEVDCETEGDTHFPSIEPQHWREISREDRPADEANEYPFAFVEYQRR